MGKSIRRITMPPETDDLLSRQVDAAIAEYLDSAKRGITPERAEFIARHSAIRAELEQFLADQHALDEAAQHANFDSTSRAVDTTGRTARASRGALTDPQPFGKFELTEEIARG